MPRIPFQAKVVIDFLEELLAIEPGSSNEIEPIVRRNAELFFSEKKYAWDLTDVEPELILEVLILEAQLNAKSESVDMEDVMDDYYYPHFNNTFFDPEPNPKLSLAGWINFNYGQQYEEKFDTMPAISIWPAVEIINTLLEYSPTCDELLNEHIADVYLAHSETGDEEARLTYFYNDGADLIYDLSKAIVKIKPMIRKLHESFEDELPNDLGMLLLSDLHDDFLEAFEGDDNEEAIRYHPLTLVKNLLEDLDGELT